jgi:mannose-1-phosphate guanylyltransferase/mannose-1-phosphate guanylyltransferase/mannose-6-phosphate isomerase
MNREKEERPWGKFERFTLNEISTVKIITVNPKQKLSIQYHHKREEFWRFLDNPARVTLGDKTIDVKEGDEVVIPKKTIHAVEALSKPVRFLEIAFGKFDEGDIVRLEDRYGRV